MSRARRQANRQNALKSTGPRTGAGKSRPSKNALSHGLSQPIDESQVGDALDRLQNVLTDAGYQPTHAFRVALCLLDYDRVDRAEDELHHRMMCLASGIALKDPRIPNSLMPLPLDNQRDIDIAALYYVSLKTAAVGILASSRPAASGATPSGRKSSAANTSTDTAGAASTSC